MAEDNSWVFDSLVCFLHGPVWNAPLQTFIEDKSIIFDPNLQPDEGNPEYRKVHDEYKNLVDYMLGSFMEEMQITPEQFEFACLEGRHVATLGGGAPRAASAPATEADGEERSGANTFSFHQGLFQQIWAANDIRIFIRMMVQRNVELQLQALDLIERRSQSLGSKSTDGEEGGIPAEQEEKEQMLQTVKLPAAESELSGEGNSSEGELELDIQKAVENELRKDPEPAVMRVWLNGGHPIVEDLLEGELATGGSDKFQRLNLFFDQEKVGQWARECRCRGIFAELPCRPFRLSDQRGRHQSSAGVSAITTGQDTAPEEESAGPPAERNDSQERAADVGAGGPEDPGRRR
uniref:Cilia- and flagella-associated protein 36 n=1 Tax=Anopheles atroparvus TaxID=41427 RepID=A0AAG5CTM7_ANOAO